VTLPLHALFIATFCMATTPLAVVGLISDIQQGGARRSAFGPRGHGSALGPFIDWTVFPLKSRLSCRKTIYSKSFYGGSLNRDDRKDAFDQRRG
jgi:hypothetical protein